MILRDSKNNSLELFGNVCYNYISGYTRVLGVYEDFPQVKKEDGTVLFYTCVCVYIYICRTR